MLDWPMKLHYFWGCFLCETSVFDFRFSLGCFGVFLEDEGVIMAELFGIIFTVIYSGYFFLIRLPHCISCD